MVWILALPLISAAPLSAHDQPQLHVIAFGVHPNDCELKSRGLAAKYAASDLVKFVSLTNGDADHYAEGGGPLAKRRRAEVMEPAAALESSTRCSTTMMGS